MRAAREARGIITASGLAEMIGVSRAAVSQYERGEQTPSPEILRVLSHVLNLPPQHFIKPQRSSEGVHFFRSLASATKSARLRAHRKYEWLLDVVAFLREYVEFPEVVFPSLGNDAKGPLGLSNEMIEDAATQLRRHWGLGDGPISNVTWLLENKGAIVSRLDFESEKLDAFSRWNPEQQAPFVILGTEKGYAARSRFNAAHEVAHMVLHRHVAAKQFASPSTFKELERQANRFAGAFLLPGSTFLNELYNVTLDTLKSLKPRWKVSIALMLKRAEDLGAIKESHAKNLWMNLARRGWKRKEPFDDSIPIELPRFLPRCFEMLIKDGIVRREELSHRLALSSGDIEELANLPDGCLQPLSPEKDIPAVTPKILKFPQA